MIITKKVAKAEEEANELMMRAEELNDENEMESHALADDALIVILRGLGYNSLCDRWEDLDKWYA